jgi:hypothetical protein
MAKEEPKDLNSPWSVTDREFGALEQELKEVRHDLRNLKFVVNESGIFDRDVRESLTKLQNLKARLIDLDELKAEFNQFKTRIYTIFSVVVVLAGLVAWLIDTVLTISASK